MAEILLDALRATLLGVVKKPRSAHEKPYS